LKASSGYSRLDQSAINAVKNWRFIPAKRGEQAIDSWIVVPILFSLKDIDLPANTKPKNNRTN
jgi:protein TonB